MYISCDILFLFIFYFYSIYGGKEGKEGDEEVKKWSNNPKSSKSLQKF